MTTLQRLGLLFSDKSLKITGFLVVSVSTVLVTYERKKDNLTPYRHGCAFIPAQVNAVARIYLLSVMRVLEKNRYIVVYGDTDSIVYMPSDVDLTPANQLLPIGSRLGSFKHEWSEGALSFHSFAKKSYLVEFPGGVVKIKAKGFHSVLELLENNRQSQIMREELMDCLGGNLPQTLTLEQQR